MTTGLGWILNFLKQPRPGVGPPAFRGGFGNAEDFGGFLDLQAEEVTEFDQFGLFRLERGELVQSFVKREQLIVGRGAGDFEFIHVEMRGTGASALPSLASGPVDEDATHRFGGGPEEVRAVLPRLAGRVHQLQPCFMDEGRRLEGVAGRFASHLLRRQSAQFVVEQRQQLIGGLGVTLLDRREYASHVAHIRRLHEKTPASM